MPESEDLRAFIRDLMARFDRGMDAVLRQQEILREENRRYFESLEKKTNDILEENREGRRALLAILDRLDNGGTAPAG